MTFLLQKSVGDRENHPLNQKSSLKNRFVKYPG
jgi:hypothetical protein